MAEPMEVDETPFQNSRNGGAPTNDNDDEDDGDGGAVTPAPCHINTGVYSGHAGLQAFLTLGVPINAPLSAIKSAYRKLAREYHPDRGGKGRVTSSPEERAAMNEKFSQISHAYGLLTHAYSEYTGKKGAGEHYSVFFGTPGSLDSHTKREGDPYDLYRQNAGTELPHTAPEHCIFPGDSSSLFFKSWSEPDVPLALPYEAQPPPLLPPKAAAGDVMMDDTLEEASHTKRAMDDDEMDMPRQKRRRMADPSLFGENASLSVMQNGTSSREVNWGVKRDANEAGGMDFRNPSSAKKRRTA